jgi:hypothetical protein
VGIIQAGDIKAGGGERRVISSVELPFGAIMVYTKSKHLF